MSVWVQIEVEPKKKSNKNKQRLETIGTNGDT